ncbi:hypothetical protein QVD17_30054 [Tagetes erecta]|uniref:E2 ubiquitin-conjugating enzyme n=1 Tax=Tagetes erecta TaxID=13708 RepID=A0AAD8K781_TARER|nr:hypothetical protein QVD17_30054 [Tagetes erecta]
MESSTIARYIPHKSKKRFFSESSSSYAEPEVIEINPPLSDRTARMKAKGKQKEVARHEIIDVDMDDDYNDVVLLKGKVGSRKKTRLRMGISLGPNSEVKMDMKKVVSNEKGKDISVEPGHFPKGFNPGSNNFFDLDDYVYDDDYSKLQSHFDKIDFPAGIEASFPLLPDLGLMKKGNLASNSQLGSSQGHLNMVDPWLSSVKKNKVVPGQGQPTYFGPSHVPAQPMHSNFTPIGSGNYLPNNSDTQVGNGTSYLSKLAMNGGWHGSLMKNYMNSSAGMLPGTGGVYSMNGMLLSQDATVNGPSSLSSKPHESSSRSANLVDGDVRKRYESFKQFDTVVDCSDHYYVNQKEALKQPPKNWAKKIQDEWRILEKDLPDTIFVRVYESRMDLLRAVIIGAEGTPYHDGLFFFDVFFPSNYPSSPPLVHYHSGGLRINPNLYNCGKVCLSLLNTWSGGHKEKWLPGTSTMLQVLVSIQGLILNMKPYFNEPGFARSSGSVQGEKCSLQYNENTLILSLKTMVYTMNNPPKHFEDLVIGHFQHRVRDILMACKAYTEGVQVGSLVKGGVQDVDEGNNSCSPNFKHDVGSYIKTLIAAFTKIGAKEAEDFHYLGVKNSSLPFAPTPTPFPYPHSPANVYYPTPAYSQHW